MRLSSRASLIASVACLLASACGDDQATPADGAIGDAAVVDAPVTDAALYRLSETGLYTDINTLTLSPDALEYEPSYRLWSDAAAKTRWLLLPPGEVIDTSDMDRWRLPIGTKLFKQFVVDGKRIETRLIWRTGPGDTDYFMGAFLWDEDGGDAVFVPEGQRDANGTTHDVPRTVKCWDCHEGEPGRAIGFSAIQLSHSGPGPTLDSLAADSLLSDPPPETYPVPGDAITAAAIGYLHANCGNCHNPLGRAYEDISLELRLNTAERDPSTSQLFLTTVGVALERWLVPPYIVRINPGLPDTSGIIGRMSVRGPGAQMPPIGTEVVDDIGVAAVRAWITSLSAPP